MITKVKIGAAFLAVVLLAGLAVYTVRINADRDRLAGELAGLSRELAAAKNEAAMLAQELRLNYQALSARQAEVNRLEKETAADQAAIREVCVNDQTAEAYINTIVPVDIAAWLCGPASVHLSGTDSLAAPGGLPSGCAGAKITNGDLINWTLELRKALRQSNSDKAALRRWAAEAVE